MKIAFISYEFPPGTGKGGIGTYVKQMAAALAGLNWEVHVFAGSNEPGISNNTEGYWVHTIQCSDPHDFAGKVVATFEQHYAAVKFDLVESAEIHGNARVIKKQYPGLPLVIRLHAPNYLVEHLKNRYVPFFAKLRFLFGSIRRLKFDMGYWRPYDKNLDADYQFIQLANYITAPSESMKQWAVKYWELQPGKIKVIHNIFSPGAAWLNMPIAKTNQYKRVVFFGRLNVLKGLVNATKAMKKILLEYPEWKFRIIGDDGKGPRHNISMGSWIKKQLSPVMPQVEFIEGMDYEALPSAITESEIVLLPSLFESFSYTCAEAMAAGKAVIGSLSGGMTDLINDGESGLLTDPENADAIYTAIKKMIDDQNLRYQLSVNARARILAEFNAAETVLLFNDFYKQIISSE